jgi:hypothetical protein
MKLFWLAISLISYCTWVFLTDVTLKDFLVVISLISFGLSILNKKKKKVK